jgi:hypothetical protein
LAASSARSSIEHLGQPEAQLPECLDQIGMILLPEEQVIDAIVTIHTVARGLRSRTATNAEGAAA